MFFCIGESALETFKIGEGESATEAVKDWASTNDYTQEFQEYSPVVVSGHIVNIEFVPAKLIVK